MKKDWTYKKLGEVCDILNGYAFKSNKYVGEGIRVIRIANVQKGIIVDDQPAFYPLSTQFEIDKYILNEGDILMSLTGNVGRVGILQKEMLPAALNQRVACLRMIDNSLYSKFFFHYLNSDLFEQKCIASARGIAQLNMSTEWLKEQFIPIPSIAIQRSIVAELDLLHSVISKKKEQLRELDNLAQSLFYQMFGDPITNPMGWEIKKLGEVCGIINGKNQKSVENPNGKYVICGSGGIMGRANDYICPENSIIIGRKGNINRPILMREKYWNVDTAFGLVPNTDSLLVDYLYIFTQEYDFEQLNVAVTIPSLRKTDIAEISIPLPPLSLQQSFAAKVIAIEAQKQAITQSIQHTEALLAQRMDHYFA